jgi:hypothetical protein
MKGSYPKRKLPRVLAGIALAILSGCGGTGHARFTPRGDEARVAVETVLSAWRDGQAYNKIEVAPRIQVIDSAWRDGKAIEKFEILREEDGEDGTKSVSARLSFKKPQAESEVVYVVFGRDPIWVYREEDYTIMLNMDDNPKKTKARTARRAR